MLAKLCYNKFGDISNYFRFYLKMYAQTKGYSYASPRVQRARSVGYDRSVSRPSRPSVQAVLFVLPIPSVPSVPSATSVLSVRPFCTSRPSVLSVLFVAPVLRPSVPFVACPIPQCCLVLLSFDIHLLVWSN